MEKEQKMRNVLEMLDMKGKVVLITGGASGLGYDIACAMAEAGATLVISSRDKEKSKSAAENLAKEYNVKTLSVTFDQKNYEEVEKAVEQIIELKGKIDVLHFSRCS